MIPVGDLTAHPGNVREDLDLNEEFCASVAAEGVRIPLLITPADGGGWRVIEGHRRLAAAIQAGLAEVPCDIDPGRAGDEAGQYVDMLLANSDSYRANYTVLEEAAALFAAHEAGASRTRLRKATGRTPAQVKAALAAGSLPADTRTRAAELDRAMTLEDLALLSEFDGDQDATDRLLSAIELGYPLEHTAQRIRQDRAEAAEHARIRADLEASGVTVTDQLPDGAAWLDSLTHDGADLTPDSHAACPGHGATFRSWNLLQPAWYCTSPAEHGHASRWNLGTPAASTGSAGTSGTTTGSQPDPAPGPEPAAGHHREQGLAGSRRRPAPLARRELVPPQVRAPRGPGVPGPPAPGHAQPAQQRTARRHRKGPVRQAHRPRPGPLARHHRHRLARAAGDRHAGPGHHRLRARHDRRRGPQHLAHRPVQPLPPRRRRPYLAFLASLGYPLSAIEQAVADGIPWTGDTTPASLLTPEQPEDDAEPGGDTENPGPASDDASSPAQAA